VRTRLIELFDLFDATDPDVIEAGAPGQRAVLKRANNSGEW